MGKWLARRDSSISGSQGGYHPIKNPAESKFVNTTTQALWLRRHLGNTAWLLIVLSHSIKRHLAFVFLIFTSQGKTELQRSQTSKNTSKLTWYFRAVAYASSCWITLDCFLNFIKEPHEETGKNGFPECHPRWPEDARPLSSSTRATALGATLCPAHHPCLQTCPQDQERSFPKGVPELEFLEMFLRKSFSVPTSLGSVLSMFSLHPCTFMRQLSKLKALRIPTIR